MKYDFLINKAKPFLELPTGHSRHFSFLLRRRNIVGFGYNKSFTTHPIAKQYGYRFAAIHAELDCILSFNGPPRELKNYTLVNLRFLANGKLAMAKPCQICQSLLNNFGITDIVYSNQNGEFELCV